MTEVVVALIMMLNGNLIEFTYKEKMSDCLRAKRIAEREVRPERVQFFVKVKATNRSIKKYMGRKTSLF